MQNSISPNSADAAGKKLTRGEMHHNQGHVMIRALTILACLIPGLSILAYAFIWYR